MFGIVITEVGFKLNALPPAAHDSFEYIEIQNTSGVPVDLSGWRIRDVTNGTVHTTLTETSPGAGFVLLPGQTAIIASDPGALSSYLGPLPSGVVVFDAPDSLGLGVPSADPSGSTGSILALEDSVGAPVDVADYTLPLTPGVNESIHYDHSTPGAPVPFVASPSPGLTSVFGAAAPTNGPTEDSDILNGTSGDDTVDLMGGDDQYRGGDGNDVVLGGDGDDTIFGEDDADNLNGNAGRDHINGGRGNDRIKGGDDIDVLSGGNGNDTIHGERGNDTIYGGDGNDKLHGGVGNDFIYGGDGNDRVNGQHGADVLYGEDGDDRLLNGDGTASLDGGTGDDILKGGGGLDFFVFDLGSDRDLILDFGDGPDLIDITAYEFSGIGDLTITQVGNDTLVTLSLDDDIRLRRTDIGTIDADDFLF